jgi:hypothetical protein
LGFFALLPLAKKNKKIKQRKQKIKEHRSKVHHKITSKRGLLFALSKM